MSAGVEQLRECVELVFREFLDEVRREVRAAQDLTAPLSAEELCARWHVVGDSPELRLFNLARRCREYGLKPLKGSRGWEALYARADVLSAESYAAAKAKGKSARRRAA